MEKINSRKVMLIGGAGFIGHNLALHLKSLGADVCVVDGLQVNNIMSFSSDDVKAKNRDLYLKILFERQRLLRAAGVPLFVCLLYTSPSPRDRQKSRMPSSA